MHRFLKRLWRAINENNALMSATAAIDFKAVELSEEQQALRRKTHETIAKVTDDVGRRFTFNTAIAAIMELFNEAARFKDSSETGTAVSREAFRSIVLLLSPITPHITQVLWQKLGSDSLLMDEAWPEADEAAMKRDALELAVQVNGKLRSQITVAADADKDSVEKIALADENVMRHCDGKTVRKVIVVPGKLVNVVAN